MKRDLVKFLASLKLALLLLAVIIVATAIGTIYESLYNADVAKRLVYSHWWFDIWLLLLGINLFTVAAVRYPWKSYQTGFVITHGGIIILLFGSWVDRHWGIEGMMGLHCLQPASNVMELRSEEIQLGMGDVAPYGKASTAEAAGLVGRTPVNVNALMYKDDCQFPLQSPDSEVKAEVLDICAVVNSNVGVPTPGGDPMVNLKFQGFPSGVQDFWMKLASRESSDSLVISFKAGLPPNWPGANSDLKQMMGRNERYVVYTKHDAMIKTKVGEPTKAKATLKLDEKGLNPELTLEFQDKNFTFKVNDILSKDVPLEGLEKWSIFVHHYYPNYTIDIATNTASTVDNKPENPAVTFDLLGPMVSVAVQSETPAANPHGGGGHDSGADNRNDKINFTVYLSGDGKLRYHLTQPGLPLAQGALDLKQPVELKMGSMAVTVQALDFIPSGQFAMKWERKPTSEENRVFQLKNAFTGALCRVSYNGDVKEVWVRKTQPAKIFEGKILERLRTHDGKQMNQRTWETLYTPVEVGGRKMWLSFANRTVPLPFGIELRHFRAPRYEGSMDFMEYESVLAFDGVVDTLRLKPDSKFAGLSGQDDPLVLKGSIGEENEKAKTVLFVLGDRTLLTIPKSDIVSMTKRTQNTYMNNPTSFPNVWWGPWLGTNYKFSQADHRIPSDPEFTGLQILRDPGWSFKWIGCLLICSGIFTMFYLKPYMAGRRKAAAKK
jgi:hypothetical protein